MLSDDPKRAIVLFDGPIGVGKTALGRAVASQLAFGFIDGDEHSAPGPWYRSILRTSHRIAASSEELLHTHPVVIVSYPLRCTTWTFFQRTFERKGIACHCIGLVASTSAISTRNRVLSPAELSRSEEMSAQGYGQRFFADVVVRTDEGNFLMTQRRLAEEVIRLVR